MLRTSVIIPTYNRAAYLREALASVFGQTVPPYEVVVVDDGSTDNTPEIVSQYGDRVRYFSLGHMGVAAARNCGLAAAQGDVIAWLDSDDVWEPTFLQIACNAITQGNLDGVYSGFTSMDAAGDPLPQGSTMTVAPEDLHSALLEQDFVLTPCIAVRRECFIEVGSFDASFRICEDYDMWLRLAKKFKIAGLGQPLVRIRVHATSTIGDTEAFCKARLAVMTKHFGDPEAAAWSGFDDGRRAHAFARLECAVRWIQEGFPDRGWTYVEQAIVIWPNLLERIVPFYELACGAQPRGYRGATAYLDLKSNGADMLGRLDTLLTHAEPGIGPWRRVAFGNAYLALAMLADQADEWDVARRYLFCAVRSSPNLLRRPNIVRRMVKLSMGQKLGHLLSSARPHNVQASHGAPGSSSTIGRDDCRVDRTLERRRGAQ